MPGRAAAGYFTADPVGDRSISDVFKSIVFGLVIGSIVKVPVTSVDNPLNFDNAKELEVIVNFDRWIQSSPLLFPVTADCGSQIPEMDSASTSGKWYRNVRRAMLIASAWIRVFMEV